MNIGLLIAGSWVRGWGRGAWAVIRLCWEGLCVPAGLGYPGSDGSDKSGGHAGPPEALRGRTGETKDRKGLSSGGFTQPSLSNTHSYLPTNHQAPWSICWILVPPRNLLGMSQCGSQRKSIIIVICVIDCPLRSTWPLPGPVLSPGTGMHLLRSSPQPCEVETFLILILQMQKLRLARWQS